MQPSYDFALAIPTLNEAENLPFLLKRLETPLLAVPGNSEILIVDDDSHDGTAEIIAEYSSSHPNLRLLVRQGRSGLAGAVLYGWQQTQATTLGVMDADLQHPPELLPVLVEKVREGADIAIASRYAEKRPVNGLSAGRYAVSRLGTLVCMPLQKSGLQVRDPLSGFFVLRRKCIDGIALHPEGFKLLLEILVRGNIKTAVEVPFEFGTRLRGKSKAGLNAAVEYFSLLRKLSKDTFWRTRKSA